MPQNLEQHLGQRLSQRLTPLQVRFVRMLEMNRQEAEETVERELEVNPALEAAGEDAGEELRSGQYEAASGDVPFYRLRLSNRSADDGPGARELALMAASESESLYDHLERQLDERDLSEEERRAADYIVGNLDTSGYLRRTPEGMADDLAFNAGVILDSGQLENALKVVRSLDPPGVGAFDLRDSLLLQLRAMPPSDVRDVALRIVDEAFGELAMRRANRIISSLKLKKEAYEAAIELIQSLNPRPGASFGAGDADRPAVVVPDFSVEEDAEGELHVGIPTRVPELAVDASFRTAVEDMKRNAAARRRGDGDEGQYVQQMYRDAVDFTEIWRRRQTTLMAVMSAIVKLQHRYFLTSDEADLRPMALRDIAELTGYDLSTVSRATAGKYVATSWGILPLRHLFGERARKGDGEEDSPGSSTRSIQAALRRLIAEEDPRHPLSDEEATRRLGESGYEVKRRTVAKYREKMGFPPARLRRKL